MATKIQSTAPPEQSDSSPGRVRDYRSHYAVDAEAIVAPEALNPHWHASERRRLQTLVRQLQLSRGERVLDAGCGSGWLAERMRRAGAQVAAMDIALRGVAGAKARFPAVDSFQVGDLYHLPYASAHFDAVILSEVVEHIEDINAVFAEVARVLKPGGRLLISVPYRENIVDHLCIHCNQLTPANAHLHRFDEAALSDCCQRADLKVRRVHLMANKLAEMAGFPLLSRRWPYWSWRLVDASLNKLLPKPAFMCVLAYKRA